MTLPVALSFLAASALASSAIAAAPPLTLPTRDVDVTYEMTRPAGPADQKPALQRMRWAAGPRKLRVDPPSPGLFIVMDYREHLLSAVRPAQRLVLRIHSDGAGLATGGLPGGGAYDRKGVDRVAGLSCTDWITTDTAGEKADVCLTDDGVLLRARIGDLALIQAVQVQYGPVDMAAFDVPADFRTIVPPGQAP